MDRYLRELRALMLWVKRVREVLSWLEAFATCLLFQRRCYLPKTAPVRSGLAEGSEHKSVL